MYAVLFFFYLTHKCWSDALVSFIRLYKGRYHYDRLSSARHGLLNLPEKRRTTQSWHSVGRRAGRALIGQAGKNTIYETKS
jgi:hypothetical protein